MENQPIKTGPNPFANDIERSAPGSSTKSRRIDGAINLIENAIPIRPAAKLTGKRTSTRKGNSRSRNISRLRQPRRITAHLKIPLKSSIVGIDLITVRQLALVQRLPFVVGINRVESDPR